MDTYLKILSNAWRLFNVSNSSRDRKAQWVWTASIVFLVTVKGEVGVIAQAT